MASTIMVMICKISAWTIRRKNTSTCTRGHPNGIVNR